MKYQLLSLLLPLFAAAASIDSDSSESDYGDDFVVPEDPSFQKWDFISARDTAIIMPESNAINLSDKVENDESSFGWRIMSFLGSFFAPSSPIKQSTSSTSITSESDLTESDLGQFTELMNCDAVEISGIDSKNIQKLLKFKKLSKKALLTHIVEMNDKYIFELFVMKNTSRILAETYNIHDFRSLVLNCIKMNSERAFYTFMDTPKFTLNGPHAIIAASMYGSEEILKFVIGKQESLDYTWEWISFDGADGFMMNFGENSFDAALFVGSFKAIVGGYLECLRILKSNGVKVYFKDFLLLKKAAEIANPEAFEILIENVNVPLIAMNEILLVSIKNSNEALLNYLLAMNYSYTIQIQTHLISAINSGHFGIFTLILSKIKRLQLSNQILTVAATAGSTEIFIELIKNSSPEMILNALCNCISNTEFHHLVPEIASNVKLTPDMISQGLSLSVKFAAPAFVKIFLENEDCNAKLASEPFLKALMSNDPELFEPFFARFDASTMIRPNLLTSTALSLINSASWNALKAYVEKFFHNGHFSKNRFISQIIKTDQVELAKFAVNNGARIDPSELINAKNREMHAFAVLAISADLSKSQTKKRK